MKKFAPNVPVVQSLRSVQAVEDEKTENSTYFGARDRRRYVHWLFDAKKRHGLKDIGRSAAAQSTQFVALPGTSL